MITKEFISGWGFIILAQTAHNNYSYWIAIIWAIVFFTNDILKKD